MADEKLSADDLARIDRYLSSPIHTVERKPFRPGLLLAGLTLSVVLIGLGARLLGYLML